MQFGLRFASSFLFVAGVWYAVIQYARYRDDPVWWDRAEIVGGVAGLVTIVAWLPLAEALARWQLVEQPVLWSLKWTLIPTVVAMASLLAIKIFAEEHEYWTPPTGTNDRREVTFGDGGSTSAGSGGRDP